VAACSRMPSCKSDGPPLAGDPRRGRDDRAG
jgi:hypothetical protein